MGGVADGCDRKRIARNPTDTAKKSVGTAIDGRRVSGQLYVYPYYYEAAMLRGAAHPLWSCVVPWSSVIAVRFPCVSKLTYHCS